MARWIHHKDSSIYLTLPFSQMNVEARMWAKIIYACLTCGRNFTEVTHNRVRLIYVIMYEDIDINMSYLIFLL